MAKPKQHFCRKDLDVGPSSSFAAVLRHLGRPVDEKAPCETVEETQLDSVLRGGFGYQTDRREHSTTKGKARRTEI
jgi:hypothetical protein